MIQVVEETLTNDVVSTLLFLKLKKLLKESYSHCVVALCDEERQDKETVIDMLDTLQLETNQQLNYQPLQQQLLPSQPS